MTYEIDIEGLQVGGQQLAGGGVEFVGEEVVVRADAGVGEDAVDAAAEASLSGFEEGRDGGPGGDVRLLDEDARWIEAGGEGLDFFYVEVADGDVGAVGCMKWCL